jgi:pyruvate carboxylase
MDLQLLYDIEWHNLMFEFLLVAITEMITGIDIVKTQILVADGANLFDERVSMPQQVIRH